MKLIQNKIYKTKVSYDGLGIGTEVIFKWMSDKWAVCNPVGEPSIQDSRCFLPEELEEIDND